MRWYLIMWFWFAFLWLVILSIFSCTLGYFYIFFGKLSIWIFSSCYNGINCSVSAEAATYFMKLFPISPVKKALPPLNQSSYLSLFPPAAAAAKLRQSCPTLCDPIDGSPPGSPVPGILQARTLEWVAISFSNAWKWKVKVKALSCVWLLATPWTAAYQAPPSMGFSRQEYWSGVPLPSP